MRSAVVEKLGGRWASGRDSASDGGGLAPSPSPASSQPCGPEGPAGGFGTSASYGAKRRKGAAASLPGEGVSTARGECGAQRFAMMYGPPCRPRGLRARGSSVNVASHSRGDEGTESASRVLPTCSSAGCLAGEETTRGPRHCRRPQPSVRPSCSAHAAPFVSSRPAPRTAPPSRHMRLTTLLACALLTAGPCVTSSPVNDRRVRETCFAETTCPPVGHRTGGVRE